MAFSISPPSQLILAFTIPYRYLALYISPITICTCTYSSNGKCLDQLSLYSATTSLPLSSPQPSERRSKRVSRLLRFCLRTAFFDIPIFWRGSAACPSKIQPSSIRCDGDGFLYPMALLPPFLPSPPSLACPTQIFNHRSFFRVNKYAHVCTPSRRSTAVTHRRSPSASQISSIRTREPRLTECRRDAT